MVVGSWNTRRVNRVMAPVGPFRPPPVILPSWRSNWLFIGEIPVTRTVRKTSNRKVLCSELEGIDGDVLAKPYIEEQDRKITKTSGKPRGPIKSVSRGSRR
jgi:hypothetical protein